MPKTNTSTDLTELRRHLLKTLASAGVAKAELTYDGYADEGNVEKIEAWDAAGAPIDLAKVDVHGNPSPLPGDKTLHGLFEDWFYDAMYVNFAGWEINDGSSGEISIDVAAGTIDCDHAQRSTDYTSASL